jgi:hypothetical protein
MSNFNKLTEAVYRIHEECQFILRKLGYIMDIMDKYD